MAKAGRPKGADKTQATLYFVDDVEKTVCKRVCEYYETYADNLEKLNSLTIGELIKQAQVIQEAREAEAKAIEARKQAELLTV